MDKREKQSIKAAVIKKIASLKINIEKFKILTKPVSPDNAIGRLTRMEAINSKSINDASLAKLKQTLSNLEKSLKQIDNSDFGYCINCEEPIPHKRLLIMPESAFCVPCANKIDQR